MSWQDFINGSFELLGGFTLWLNVRRLYQDKMARGVTWGATAFFMSWGYWNLYYYPSLNQWWSFVGGLNIVAANTVWLVLMLYYMRRERAQRNPLSGAGAPVGTAWYGTEAIRLPDLRDTGWKAPAHPGGDAALQRDARPSVDV